MESAVLNMVNRGLEWVTSALDVPSARAVVFGVHISGLLLVEVAFLVVIVFLLSQKSYKHPKRPLTNKEIDELCEEWSREPLITPITEEMKFEPPVLESAAEPHKTINGIEVVNFASANYLRLIGHEKLLESCTTGLSEGNEDRLLSINLNQFQAKKLEHNWENQTILSLNPPPRFLNLEYHHRGHDHGKQQAMKSNLYGKEEDHDHNSNIHDHRHHHHQVEFEENHHENRSANWSQLMAMPISSPSSCVTNNNMLDFSYNNNKDSGRNQSTDLSSECNSTDAGVVCKKLGDRITALHQLVSPFGKNDTAAVLFEAIGYIRFLQGQIEALSSSYLSHGSKNTRNNNQQYVEVEGEHEKQNDLRSRGLCLVPVSCTHHVGSDNGADY